MKDSYRKPFHKQRVTDECWSIRDADGSYGKTLCRAESEHEADELLSLLNAPAPVVKDHSNDCRLVQTMEGWWCEQHQSFACDKPVVKDDRTVAEGDELRLVVHGPSGAVIVNLRQPSPVRYSLSHAAPSPVKDDLYHSTPTEQRV